MPGPLILVFDDSDLVLEITRYGHEAAGYRWRP